MPKLTEEERKELKSERNKAYYANNIELGRARSRANYHKHKSERLKYKKKIYLLNPDESKQRAMDWRKKNPSKRKDINLKSNRKAVSTLTDSYVKMVIRGRSSLTAKDIPQSLIKAKRAELLMKRFIKETENE